MGIAKQAEPGASEEFPGKNPPAYPSRSGASFPRGDDRHGTLSSAFEVLRHHGTNRRIFVTIQPAFLTRYGENQGEASTQDSPAPLSSS